MVSLKISSRRSTITHNKLKVKWLSEKGDLVIITYGDRRGTSVPCFPFYSKELRTEERIVHTYSSILISVDDYRDKTIYSFKNPP